VSSKGLSGLTLVQYLDVGVALIGQWVCALESCCLEEAAAVACGQVLLCLMMQSSACLWDRQPAPGCSQLHAMKLLAAYGSTVELLAS
jgi:hypothetical protein